MVRVGLGVDVEALCKRRVSVPISALLRVNISEVVLQIRYAHREACLLGHAERFSEGSEGSLVISLCLLDESGGIQDAGELDRTPVRGGDLRLVEVDEGVVVLPFEAADVRDVVEAVRQAEVIFAIACNLERLTENFQSLV